MSERAFPQPQKMGRWQESLLVGLAVSLVIAIIYSPLVVALVLAGIVVVLAEIRFKPLLLALVFFLPVTPYLSWDLLIKDLGTLVRLCLFAGVLVERIRKGHSLRKWLFGGALSRWVCLYVGIVFFVTLLGNPPTGAAARELMRLGSYVCFFIVVSDWLRSESEFSSVFTILLVSTIFVDVFAFVQAMVGDYTSLHEALYPFQEDALKVPPWSGRSTSFLSHYNSLAGYLNMVIPFCMVLALRSPDRLLRWLARLCFVLSSVALLLTQSRGGLMAYVAILLVEAWLLAPSRNARRIWVAMALVGSVAGFFVAGSLFARLSEVDEFTEVSRLVIWAGAAAIFFSAPLMGIGYGNFKEILSNFANTTEGGMIDAHNLYLQVLAETGVVGFFGFFLLVAASLKRAWILWRESRYWLDVVIACGVLGAIAGVLVHGTVDHLFHNSPQVAALFYFVVALLNARSVGLREVAGSLKQ